jgi:hypothetical protein
MNAKPLFAAAVALTGVLSLTAAARDVEPPPPPPDRGMVAFATCMRAHGLDVGDPVPNGQGSFTVEDPPSATPPQVAAHTACDPLLRAETPPEKWASVHSGASAPPTTR